MTKISRAFSPGHISGYFCPKTCKNGDKGSIGGGIVITEGVTSTVSYSDKTSVEIIRRGRSGEILTKIIGSPPIEYALSRMNVTARVQTECRLPLGSGFGLSAAALLATVSAADDCFECGYSREKIEAFAYEAEVYSSSGLGDVPACTGGGYICRKTPGLDGEIIRNYDAGEEIAAVSSGPIPTGEIIKNPQILKRAKGAFPSGCPESIEEFFRMSKQFAFKSGILTKDAEEIIRACESESVPASMTMLGNGVFAYGNSAKEILSSFGEVYTMKISESGYSLLQSK
ncbi:pantoate kinase [Methanoplanus limicola]|uniref:Pantoate kinase n=1 Tax=Methanoplanus limicola DSM 2279 TaxID=937775 RepID=H1Z1Q3_9EURY|nr:pantoate kinase [Methanoplanus limicola]EHQ34579.1 pantothenate kinase [Methanoplanus limicola DSM 2279]